MTAILKLISETASWRTFHKSRGNHIEAAACAIRLKALRDAFDAVDKDRGNRG